MQETTRKKITKWFWIIITAPVALIAVLLILVAIFAKIPSFEELENPDSKLATQVIAEGGELLTTFHIENRTFVAYDDLAPSTVQAAVATEDVRFYKHSGIDLKGLGRVLFKTLLLRDSSQGGGSTITQQLAKSLYPRENVSSRIPGVSKIRMVFIKLKEWITAVKLERDYTKDEIVDMYLNSIFFGSSAYGIRAAAETFFSKIPSELTVEESAMLVGMVNKPTRYNPALNPDKALTRRNFVIARMAKAGYITKEERDSIQQIPITLSYQVMDHNSGLAPYFRDMLRRDMTAKRPHKSDYADKDQYSADSLRWFNDPLYGWLNKNEKPNGDKWDIDRDGLRIYTTIDYRMQKFAEEAVAEYLGNSLQKQFNSELSSKTNAPFSNDVDQETIDRVMRHARRTSDRFRLQRKMGMSESAILKQFSEPTRMRLFAWNKQGYVDTTMTPDDSIRYCKALLRAAFVAIEPGTGYVKAYVGGPNYRYFKYDNVRQAKRQVGSTIKPFLYAAALDPNNGNMSPCTEMVLLPQTFLMPDGTTYTPRSTDKESMIGKTVNLRWGLANSSNNVSAYLMKQLGPEAMVEMMRVMGIQSHVDPVYSLCLGAAEITPFEMVSAYNTFPSHGTYVTPQYVTRIEDNQGNILAEFTNFKREAISEQLACQMINMMQGVVDYGTAGRLRGRYGLTMQIAGKTGTTNESSDGWFIGYTPKITAGVWCGAEDPQVHFQNGNLGQGANMALPIWGIWMKKVLADHTLGISANDVFTIPQGVSINTGCSGADAEGGAPDEEESYFE